MIVWIRLVERDILRFVRQKGRMVTSLLAPLTILAVFGAAYGTLIQAGSVYRKFLLAGMILQAMIYSATISGSSLIWDREYGFLRVVALSPQPRTILALGKIGGAGVQALLHGVVFLLVAPVVGVWMSPLAFCAALLTTFAMGLGIAGLFLALASRMKTYEDFNAVVLFLSIPMLFVSGAHFPVRELPSWLKTIAIINPVTYGVDLLKHLFLASEAMGRWRPDFGIRMDITILCGFMGLAVALATALFKAKEG